MCPVYCLEQPTQLTHAAAIRLLPPLHRFMRFLILPPLPVAAACALPARAAYRSPYRSLAGITMSSPSGEMAAGTHTLSPPYAYPLGEPRPSPAPDPATGTMSLIRSPIVRWSARVPSRFTGGRVGGAWGAEGLRSERRGRTFSEVVGGERVTARGSSVAYAGGEGARAMTGVTGVTGLSEAEERGEAEPEPEPAPIGDCSRRDSVSIRGRGGGCGSHEEARCTGGRGGSGGGVRSAVGGAPLGVFGVVGDTGVSAGAAGVAGVLGARVGGGGCEFVVGEAVLLRWRGWMNSIELPDRRGVSLASEPERENRCAPDGRRSWASLDSRRSRSAASRWSRTSLLVPRAGSRRCSLGLASRATSLSLSLSVSALRGSRRSSRRTGSTGMLSLRAAFSFLFLSSIGDRLSPASPALNRRLSFSSRVSRMPSR